LQRIRNFILIPTEYEVDSTIIELVYKIQLRIDFMNNHYFKNLILVFIVGLFYLLNATDTSMVFGIDSEKYSFVSKIGSKGTSDGQFDTPHTIAFDSSGNMYVTDTKNARVQKFDNNGTFLTKWG